MSSLEIQAYVRIQVTKSSPKTSNSKLEFYADKVNDFNRYVSARNFTIMFKFKLQDINAKNIIFQVGILCQRQKNDDKLVFLVGTV